MMGRMCDVGLHCEAPAESRGMCGMHYLRWWKHGDATLKPLHRGRGPTSSNQPYMKYRVSSGKAQYIHRIVWEEWNGPIPPGYVIHHADGNTWNNCLENLVLMTRSEHQRLYRGQHDGHRRKTH